MDKVEIANSGVDQGLEWGRGHALDDPRPQQALVVGPGGPRPGAAHDQETDAEQEGVSLAPDTARRHKKGARKAAAEQKVARQQGDLGEVDDEPQRQGDGVGGEDGPEGRRENGRHRQDKAYQIALPQGPVQGVVRVVGRLGHLEQRRMSATFFHFSLARTRGGADQDDGGRPAGVALEGSDAIRGVLRPLGVVEISSRPGDMFHNPVLEDSEAHGCGLAGSQRRIEARDLLRQHSGQTPQC